MAFFTRCRETHHPLRDEMMGFDKTRKERTRFASTHPTQTSVTAR
jgi:hypothetical protein